MSANAKCVHVYSGAVVMYAVESDELICMQLMYLIYVTNDDLMIINTLF